ncbi:hypothetical protein H9Y04_13995 [Streptomyces sp. TRM66268-LWL]|uniref:Integral membrane protein n=1 Tax=Streptomyces polyasparticus TaxID=2767826 RepID=A0ABR7SGR7_9ACTN|nr:hypothetical protein [Streptomyces polyasparticus]MBC9713681.1 hypothetical protein [Streptomyces polyasparticus]
MTAGAPRPDRTPAEARVAGLLGALGLGAALWLDTWADGETAHLAFVIWAAVGIGVFTAGIITQCDRIRRERARSSGAPRTSHNEGYASGLVPAPRQESPHGVTAAQEARTSGSRAGG